ncbi:hypothetical protein NBO_451g0007 [Nosema bombycis CQ1]|uniref:Uncharacterized protein n=1 Tax=Nosema bombycis (strain CQ1 / CVCC 102059) TaxID=578461 RepID=R0KNZ3_NOSB1|nr:hypothetical protein NBO_451g0007 [Nosema bombycis CQ1]|eukprot:EOB12396.1 hypothetical protein NBO_451g0007 [Nosema bombycis CQ1]
MTSNQNDNNPSVYVSGEDTLFSMEHAVTVVSNSDLFQKFLFEGINLLKKFATKLGEIE